VEVVAGYPVQVGMIREVSVLEYVGKAVTLPVRVVANVDKVTPSDVKSDIPDIIELHGAAYTVIGPL
jgi:hypothetical protein